MTTSTRRVGAPLLLALIWAVAVLASLAALLSAYLGRANWGNGQPPDSWALTILLISLAVLAPLTATWGTRAILRRRP